MVKVEVYLTIGVLHQQARPCAAAVGFAQHGAPLPARRGGDAALPATKWTAIQAGRCTHRIDPEKWEQDPHGDEGGGFWAVGLLGRTVVWFNDIEDGFNRSPYSQYGTIDAYYCNQDELEWTVQHLLDAIGSGYDAGPFAGAPQPLK